ncbi:hypothetical protein ACQP2F_13675 [Actinoplanes sp. CA-030573]|uniref:hypothetical protein n=1 Tax=Actinoplanes sp. CA-030573 TaxID=3239898 RepID=UPI003D8DAEDD
MKVFRVLTAALLGFLAVLSLVSPASAAPRPDATSVPSELSPDNPNIPYRYSKFVPLKIASAYGNSIGSASALPSGCGLYVTLTRSGNNLHSSVLTKCINTNFALVRTNSNLSRSRWYGWQSVKTGERRADNASSVALDTDYNCGGTGKHDFKLVGSGYLVAYIGSTYTASAYDRIDGVSCG